jgi:hypothetical protein
MSMQDEKGNSFANGLVLEGRPRDDAGQEIQSAHWWVTV